MNPKQDELQPVTFDELVERCMGELTFAQKVLENFLETCEPQLDAIRQDIGSEAWDECAKKVHRLRGTAATIAARPLHRCLEELETVIHDVTRDRCRCGSELLETAGSECRRIASFVGERQSSP